MRKKGKRHGPGSQKLVDEAAEKFAGAIKESYQALGDWSVSARELNVNARLTQEFFNGVIDYPRTQASSNRAVADDLIEQQRKQREGANAYMDFLNSVFSYYRGNLDEAQKRANR